MSIIPLLTFIFLLPGYLTLKVIASYAEQFGSKFTTIDKALVSLLFDVVIFAIILFISKCTGLFSSLITVRSIESFYSNAYNFLLLVILLFVIAYILGLISVKIIGSLGGIYGNTYFKTYWNDEIVKPNSTAPVRVYNLSNNTEKPIMEGFIHQLSLTNDFDNLEVIVKDTEIFQEGRRLKLISLKPKYVYYSPSGDIMIEIFEEINA
ncbi:hypothetical protein [uncultured Marinococcus sp.]|uniref:hypothetical protein n=1 Tax=uncultured Marinococcus sp. TaxID=487012 RepID=UPI00262CCD5A|nr:hypothetical protein [uncultured Marinococcus sp.]